MEDNYNKYENRVQTIVKNEIKTERIRFEGKMITREIAEKQWNIPKIITTDIGFQMMFGFKQGTNPKKSRSNLQGLYSDTREN